VLFRFQPSCTAADLCCISQRFPACTASAGILLLSGGPDSSPAGLQHGLTHGWLLQFANAVARDTYLTQQANLEFINFS
jgi:hypothetical protein